MRLANAMAARRPRHSDPTDEIDYPACLAPFALAPSAGLAVAVSGGPDSMALLHLAAAEAKRTGRRLHALTVDHGLRRAAGAEARQVGRWAAALGVPHTVLTWTGRKPTANIQASARAMRYRLMAQWCATHHVAALLVAHTCDDQAETVLLRLARGSGVDGLAAMAADTTRDGVRILRPLLGVARASLLALLAAKGQRYITDPSNTDKRHARARLRALAPALAAEGLTAHRLTATAARMAQARNALDAWTQHHVRRTVAFHASGHCEADLDALLEVPEDIALRCVAKLVMAVTGNIYPPRLHHTQTLAARLRQPDFNGATLGGARFMRRGRRLLVCREARAVAPAMALAAPPATPVSWPVLWDGRFTLTDPDGALSTPTRCAGWAVGPLGRSGWRHMRDLLPRTPIPAAIGACLPAVYCGGDLVEAPSLRLRADGGCARMVAEFVGPLRAGLTDRPIGAPPRAG